MAATLAKRIDQIAKLRVRTLERAASVPEATAAATAIGRILMRHPDLAVVAEPSRPKTRTTSRQGESKGVELSARLVRETSKAVLFRMLGDDLEFWIPKSQIISADWSFNSVVVTAWIWRQKQTEVAV